MEHPAVQCANLDINTPTEPVNVLLDITAQLVAMYVQDLLTPLAVTTVNASQMVHVNAGGTGMVTVSAQVVVTLGLKQ